MPCRLTAQHSHCQLAWAHWTVCTVTLLNHQYLWNYQLDFNYLFCLMCRIDYTNYQYTSLKKRRSFFLYQFYLYGIWDCFLPDLSRLQPTIVNNQNWLKGFGSIITHLFIFFKKKKKKRKKRKKERNVLSHLPGQTAHTSHFIPTFFSCKICVWTEFADVTWV